MTAAPESLTLPRAAYAASGAHFLTNWERVLLVLAVCLPVPAFAATGLSIPLPATVERLAAALVPWADTASLEANEEVTVGADGTIVLAPREAAGTQVAQAAAAAIVAPARDEPAGKPGRKHSTKADGTKSGETAAGGAATTDSGGTSGGGAGGSGGGGSGGGSGSGSGSTSSSGPVQTVVDTATEATQPVVGAVEGAVDDTVGTATGVVGGVVGGVGKTTGGLLPVQEP